MSGTMLDGLPLCARCGLLAADHVVSVTDCEGFVTPTDRDASDRVREALLSVLGTASPQTVLALVDALGIDGMSSDYQAADALLRAECGADTARVREQYWELISQVEKVTPNETRHESALRLIKQGAASLEGGPSQSAEASRDA